MKNITFENYKKYVGKKVEVDIYCYAAGIMYPEDNILIGMNPGTYYFYSQEDDHYWHWGVTDDKGGKDWSIEVGFDGGAIPQIGEKIYVGSSYYLSRGRDDFEGGLASINSVEISDRLPEDHCNAIMIGIEERPGVMYNYKSLLKEQEAFKERFGDSIAHPEPDLDPDFNLHW